MPSPNAVFTELVTTTFRNHRKELADNVSRNNALLTYLKRKKKFRTEDGGLTITTPLEYAENSTYQRYSGFDVLNVAQSDVMTAAEFQWRQIAVNVVASGRELRINKGSSRIINLAKSRLKNAMNTYRNQFSADMYSDGTLANQVNGIQALIADNGTGTVGGIDAGTWAFWRNAVQSAAAPLQGGGAIVPGPTTIESLMLPLYLDLVRGNDMVDLIVASNDYFSFYEQSQTSLKRYTGDGSSAGSAAGGFISLKYKTADVIFDGNSGIPQSRMYFCNTDYIEVVSHPDADMTVQDETKPYNQDAVVIPILWMGNLVITNRRLQGVLRP
jgi:hypothetical protein